MTERWETPEEIAAVRERLERELGWQRPKAWALLAPDGTVARANVDTGYLPGVILAAIVGHTGGTASYQLSAADVVATLVAVEPAEACTEMEHPNIRALRYLDEGGAGAVVVFIAEEDFAGDFDDENIASMPSEVRRGR